MEKVEQILIEMFNDKTSKLLQALESFEGFVDYKDEILNMAKVIKRFQDANDECEEMMLVETISEFLYSIVGTFVDLVDILETRVRSLPSDCRSTSLIVALHEFRSAKNAYLTYNCGPYIRF